MGKSLVRILVVDDHKSFRRLLGTKLETRPDFQVIGEAKDGMEAIQTAKELKPDLILLDIGLPKLNGIETASRLSRIVPEAKILVVSVNNDPDIVAATRRSGARGYVWKASVNSVLLPAVEAVLKGDKFFHVPLVKDANFLQNEGMAQLDLQQW